MDLRSYRDFSDNNIKEKKGFKRPGDYIESTCEYNVKIGRSNFNSSKSNLSQFNDDSNFSSTNINLPLLHQANYSRRNDYDKSISYNDIETFGSCGYSGVVSKTDKNTNKQNRYSSERRRDSFANDNNLSQSYLFMKQPADESYGRNNHNLESKYLDCRNDDYPSRSDMNLHTKVSSVKEKYHDIKSMSYSPSQRMDYSETKNRSVGNHNEQDYPNYPEMNLQTRMSSMKGKFHDIKSMSYSPSQRMDYSETKNRSVGNHNEQDYPNYPEMNLQTRMSSMKGKFHDIKSFNYSPSQQIDYPKTKNRSVGNHNEQDYPNFPEINLQTRMSSMKGKFQDIKSFNYLPSQQMDYSKEDRSIGNLDEQDYLNHLEMNLETRMVSMKEKHHDIESMSYSPSQQMDYLKKENRSIDNVNELNYPVSSHFNLRTRISFMNDEVCDNVMRSYPAPQQMDDFRYRNRSKDDNGSDGYISKHDGFANSKYERNSYSDINTFRGNRGAMYEDYSTSPQRKEFRNDYDNIQKNNKNIPSRFNVYSDSDNNNFMERNRSLIHQDQFRSSNFEENDSFRGRNFMKKHNYSSSNFIEKSSSNKDFVPVTASMKDNPINVNENDLSDVTVDLVKNTDGPAGKNVVVVVCAKEFTNIKDVSTQLYVLRRTAKWNKKEFKHIQNYDSQRKLRTTRICFDNIELSYFEHRYSDVAKSAVVDNAFEKLVKTYYILKIKTEYFSDGSIYLYNGEQVQMNDLQKYEEPVGGEYDFKKLKKIIDDYADAHTIYDLVFYFGAVTHKNIMNYITEVKKLTATLLGGKTKKTLLVVSKVPDVWSIVKHVLEGDAIYTNSYQLIRPGLAFSSYADSDSDQSIHDIGCSVQNKDKMDSSTISIKFIKDIYGPVGRKLMVIINFKESDNKLTILKTTAKWFCRKFKYIRNFDFKRKMRETRIAFGNVELAYVENKDRNIATRLALETALQKLRESYYTLKIKTEYFSDGFVYIDSGERIKKEFYWRKFKQYDDVKFDFEKLKSIIDEYRNSNQVYELLLLLSNDKAGPLLEYAKSIDDLRVRQVAAKKIKKYVVVSKKCSVWTIVLRLLEKDIRYLPHYELIPPGVDI